MAEPYISLIMGKVWGHKTSSTCHFLFNSLCEAGTVNGYEYVYYGSLVYVKSGQSTGMNMCIKDH